MAQLDRARPSIYPDKSGDALNVQRFQMLEDIARELAGNVIFPTSFDAACKLRKTLQDRERTLDDIVRVLAPEPLISAKLIQLANTPRYNHNGKRHADLQSAVSGLGIETVRSTALAIVMTQFLRAKGMAEYADLSNSLLDHSIRSAAAARVIATHYTRLNPETAMLAGLIHDLGAFYMLYRAAQYDELRRRPDTIKHVIVHWHESIGVSLLNALGLPEEIILATEDHDRKAILLNPPRTLADIVHIANMLAGSHSAWLHQGRTAHDHTKAKVVAAFEHLIPEIDALAEKMRKDLT